MTASAFEQAADAMVTVCKGASPKLADAIDRSRFRAVAMQEKSAVIVGLPVATAAQTDLSGQPMLWDVSTSVECFARATAQLSATQASDALAKATATRLLADKTLGGVVSGIAIQGYVNEFDPAGDQSALCTLTVHAFLRATPNTI